MRSAVLKKKSVGNQQMRGYYLRLFGCVDIHFSQKNVSKKISSNEAGWCSIVRLQKRIRSGQLFYCLIEKT